MGYSRKFIWLKAVYFEYRMSSIPFTKTTKEEEKEDNDRYERYTKGFIAMTAITAITSLIIIVACFLYAPAKCDDAGDKSIFFQTSIASTGQFKKFIFFNSFSKIKDFILLKYIK